MLFDNNIDDEMIREINGFAHQHYTLFITHVLSDSFLKYATSNIKKIVSFVFKLGNNNRETGAASV